MLGLFIVLALVPIAALAAYSYRGLVLKVNAERRQHLENSARVYAAGLRDRLDFVSAGLDAAATPMSRALFNAAALATVFGDSAWARRVRSVTVTLGDGTVVPVAGPPLARPTLNENRLNHLRARRTVLTGTSDSTGARVLLVRALGRGNVDLGVIYAELAGSYLFAVTDSLLGAHAATVCVVLADGSPVKCPRELQSVGAAVGDPGTVVKDGIEVDGARYLASAATLDLRPDYLGVPWLVVAATAEANIVQSLGELGKIFPFVAGLTLLAVLIISHFTIRQRLRPLKLLQEATGRVAAGRYGEPVSINSRDEFQELAHSFNVMASRVETQFRVLTTMHEIDRTVLSTSDVDKIVDTVLERTSQIVPCEAVVCCLSANEEVDETWTTVGRPVGGSQSVTETVQPTKGEIEELWNHSDHVILDLYEQPRSYVDLSTLAARGIRHFIAFPITVKSQVAGCIALGFTSEPTLDEEHLTRTRRVADQVTVALSNARLISELNQLNFGTLGALARTIDASSPWTAGHSERVTNLALLIGREMRLPKRKLDILHRGGLLHDIGKIGTPPAILNKPGRLNQEELKIMQDHTVVGAKILSPISQYTEIIPIVRHHHERLDGKGYPDGLSGDHIPFLARVLAVADVFDALQSDRPYRAGWPEEKVIAEIQNMAGSHLDPQVVDAFLAIKAPTLSDSRKSVPYLSIEVEDFYTWID